MRLLADRPWLLVPALCAALCTAHGQGRLQNVWYPTRDANNQLTSQVHGEDAHLLLDDDGEENVDVIGMKMELYADGEKDIKIESARCLYKIKENVVLSESDVHIDRANLVIDGRGFECRVPDQEVRIFSNVNMQVANTADWMEESAIAAHSPTGTTIITSRELIFDYGERHGIFNKEVRVVDGGMVIDSDRMTVDFFDDNRVKTIHSQGNVKITQQDEVATCSVAQYDVRSSTIIMAGRAEVRRGDEMLRGDTITITRKDNRVVSVPGYLRLDGARAAVAVDAEDESGSE